jgi:hypothetical protein
MKQDDPLKGSEWITLETTPPSSQQNFDRLARALGDARIPTEVEENPVRQCERDPAAWLHVRSCDLALALEVKRRVLGE